MEKHAAPPTMHGNHPHFHKAQLNQVPDETLNILLSNKFVQLQHKELIGDFPRLIINIKDKNLRDLAKAKNPDYYAHPHVGDTINNIRVEDLKFCNCNCHKKDRGYEQILGNVEYNDAICYGNCRHTLFAAAKRQVKSAPTPSQQVSSDFFEFAKKIIDKELGPYLKEFKYSYTQWYNHLTRAKQKRMDDVEHYYYGDHTTLDPLLIKKFNKNHYEAICKAEIEVPDGKPRMVCAIPDRVKYVMGPITWALEEIAADHLKGYCGGKNLTQMAEKINKYIDQGFTQVLQGDGSAFDNTQDVTLKIERYIYSLIEPHVHHVPLTEFQKTAYAAYKIMDVRYNDDNNPAKQKKLMTYHILGTVFSGDCDTTLANTIRMALYNRYVLEKAGYRIGRDYQLFSKGDDFSVLTRPYIPQEHLEIAYYQYFLKASPTPDIVDDRVYGLGQVCKYLEFGDPSTFRFCSLRSWFIDQQKQHITLTRDPAKLYTLAKFSRKSKNLTLPKFVLYLIDQAVSLQASYKGIDIFDTMACIYITKAASIFSILKTKLTAAQLSIMTNAIAEVKEARRTLELELDRQSEIPHAYYKLLYSVGNRKRVINIKENYWETVKYIEMARNDDLTQTQLNYVNQQINAEFDLEELKALLAL